MDEKAPGFLVRSPCGREWFVPLETVGRDYTEFLMQADKLDFKAAFLESEKNRSFWPTWFSEQCNHWVDIERLGQLIKKSTLFKTKAALDNRRHRTMPYVEDYDEIGIS